MNNIDSTTTDKSNPNDTNDVCMVAIGGVVDAAGGSGHVSMALGLIGVRSTVFDPCERVGKLPGRDRKVWNRELRRFYDNQQQQQQLVCHPTNVEHDDNNDFDGNVSLYCQPTVPEVRPYETLRAWFGVPPDGIDSSFRNPDRRQDEIPIVGVSLDTNDDLRSSSTTTIVSLRNVTAIVALHPDEATDAVVDYAVREKIPFCIVPCCVFYRLFPYRKMIKHSDNNVTADNNDADNANNDTNNAKYDIVSTHADLLDYLQSKHPSIQRTKLPFPGSNTILWSYF